MAETLTVDNTPQTEIVGESEGVQLTAEEQDSLTVGEQITEAQDQLLAGKYRTAEELEKAYGELERKLGEKGNQDSETTNETEVQESNEVSQKEEKASEDSQNFYLEDGKVNYESVNEAYGEQLGNIFKNADVDPWAISKHFHENNGDITDKMFNSLVDAGLSKDSVNAYLAGRAVELGYNVTETEVSQSDINSIKNSIGGENEYNNVVMWARDNMSESDTTAFNDLLETGNVGAIKLAAAGLKAQYDNANGYEGRMLSGKAPENSKDTFRSQAELVRAMSDSRYDDDPAYRQDVIEKLDRSDLQF